MRIGVTLRILGTLLVFFSATLVPPSIVSIIYQDGLLITFGQAGITIFIVGAVLMTIFKQFANELAVVEAALGANPTAADDGFYIIGTKLIEVVKGKPIPRN